MEVVLVSRQVANNDVGLLRVSEDERLAALEGPAKNLPVRGKPDVVGEERRVVCAEVREPRLVNVSEVRLYSRPDKEGVSAQRRCSTRG